MLSAECSMGAVAQLGERLVCNQEATGSIPVSSTRILLMKRAILALLCLLAAVLCSLAIAGIAWAAWVLASGDGWLLDLTFSRPPAVGFTLLCSVSVVLGSLSFWGAKRIFRMIF